MTSRCLDSRDNRHNTRPSLKRAKLEFKNSQRFSGLFLCIKIIKKKWNSRNGRKCPTWGVPDPPKPLISQNWSCPESRLLCTQKKRIWTTVIEKLPKLGQILKVFIFYSFWTISRFDDFGSSFKLLCWDRGSKKPTFRTTSILTYKGTRGVRAPPPQVRHLRQFLEILVFFFHCYI